MVASLLIAQQGIENATLGIPQRDPFFRRFQFRQGLTHNRARTAAARSSINLISNSAALCDRLQEITR